MFENWQKMIAACTGFGGDYKPSNANLTIGSITALLTDVETEMDGVQTSIVPWKKKVAANRASRMSYAVRRTLYAELQTPSAITQTTSECQKLTCIPA